MKIASRGLQGWFGCSQGTEERLCTIVSYAQTIGSHTMFYFIHRLQYHSYTLGLFKKTFADNLGSWGQ